jgi:hypothetical protein
MCHYVPEMVAALVRDSTAPPTDSPDVDDIALSLSEEPPVSAGVAPS